MRTASLVASLPRASAVSRARLGFGGLRHARKQAQHAPILPSAIPSARLRRVIRRPHEHLRSAIMAMHPASGAFGFVARLRRNAERYRFAFRSLIDPAADKVAAYVKEGSDDCRYDVDVVGAFAAQHNVDAYEPADVNHVRVA